MFEPTSTSWGSAFMGPKHLLTRYLKDFGRLGSCYSSFHGVSSGFNSSSYLTFVENCIKNSCLQYVSFNSWKFHGGIFLKHDFPLNPGCWIGILIIWFIKITIYNWVGCHPLYTLNDKLGSSLIPPMILLISRGKSRSRNLTRFLPWADRYKCLFIVTVPLVNGRTNG